MRSYSGNFDVSVTRLVQAFINEAERVENRTWQSQDISQNPNMITRELREVSLQMGIPEDLAMAGVMTRCNIDWAEEHFQERVGTHPLNPPPSNARWPYMQQGHTEHLRGGQFSHTYPERFWPKRANQQLISLVIDGREQIRPRRGIRFAYGDLSDVVELLIKDPSSRQAYLPVWFPEDTGATEKQRVPCTLGYLTMIRNDRVHITYHMRSCDFIRHFRDDVYMAMRLGQWIRDRLAERTGVRYDMGDLTMHISSLHVFEGDIVNLADLLSKTQHQASKHVLGAMG